MTTSAPPIASAEIREAVVGVTERRDPAFGGGDEERQGDEGHPEHEESAYGGGLRIPRMQAEQDAERNDDRADEVAGEIGAVFGVPRLVFGDQLAFGVHVRLVVLRLVHQEAHDGTVGDEGDDAFRLVLRHLEPAYPQQNDDDPDPGKGDAPRFRTRHGFEDG